MPVQGKRADLRMCWAVLVSDLNAKTNRTLEQKSAVKSFFDRNYSIARETYLSIYHIEIVSSLNHMGGTRVSLD